jgi:quaternary ammonium compound-resistance protein SugE
MAWLLLIVAGLFGDRLGDRAEVLRRLHALLAQRHHRVGDAGEHSAARIAMKSLPVGTSYAIWVGVGATGTAILGIVLFGRVGRAPAASRAWRSSLPASSG